jgi:CheY-like chemotaxis protein
VLVVDDDADIRTLVGHALACDAMIHSRIAGSGQEALAILNDWLPDCILLDSRMPTMRGETLILALHVSPRAANIPIIMFSASATHDDAERYSGLGAVGLIPKPFDPVMLAHQVRAVLARTHVQSILAAS